MPTQLPLITPMPRQIFTRPEDIKRVITLPVRTAALSEQRARDLPLSRPLVMAILNVTPDSFSDGGRYRSPQHAVECALEMFEQGADIIDIGGESTRPGSTPISAEAEMSRVIPIIRGIRQESDIAISIDTYKASTARAAIDAGADIINDITAFRADNDMVTVAAQYKTPVILMHMLGTPAEMQKNPYYVECVREICEFFESRIAYCIEHGIDKSKIILDPGIGFGKRLMDNVQILANLDEFRQFGLPLLVGASRKSFINMLNPTDKKPEERLGGSVAAAVVAVLHGADIVRVHDVSETIEALKVVQAIKES
ncbi:MAG: dihydropteroate synthase [Candidatus Zixiibacteriota bacterium]